MTETVSAIQSWWPVLAALVAVVMWLARLEARGVQSSKDLLSLETRIEKQRKEDMAVRQQDRDYDRRILESVQADIKLILQRTAK
jgi:hypothetical protein